MEPENPEGTGWCVRKCRDASTGKRILGVFNRTNQMLSAEACRACIEQAAAGNPEAITAILLCTEDKELQGLLK